MVHLVQISSAELTFSQVQVRKFHHEKPRFSLFKGLGAKALHFHLQKAIIQSGILTSGAPKHERFLVDKM